MNECYFRNGYCMLLYFYSADFFFVVVFFFSFNYYVPGTRGIRGRDETYTYVVEAPTIPAFSYFIPTSAVLSKTARSPSLLHSHTVSIRRLCTAIGIFRASSSAGRQGRKLQLAACMAYEEPNYLSAVSQLRPEF